ncbi:outer membrane protein assembly complex, YaeT protein [Desulfatibacillum aliphaticivorans]|uniref:Outer membrane protein assembly factor BamA n=1 Tax=Desulfatibacillum aliphaticivorans TaxID=218208 RepID=B8FFS9_DESAL|nr:outer membrane protein assembly factor BamA [Desulfatibacillum aliphaticivorans]ACL03484.1 outer membrane protein assembly complex, YaeT protein [Desulfatibacillum aliphaticivorans]
MKKPLLAALFLCILATPMVWADSAPTVEILPFSIHTMENLGYLSTQIPKELEKNLDREGAIASVGSVAVPEKTDPARMDIQALRELGRKASADYLVWGSFSKVGNRYSLDAKVLSTYVESPIKAAYVEGYGMETLMGKVGELSKDVASKVLGRKTVMDIKVVGNSRIESDAIIEKIKTKKGDMYSPGAMADDIRAIFAMGYFEDIRVESQETAGGVIITFTVLEKPTLHMIKLAGNKKIEDDDILAAMDISRGSILNIRRIEDNINKIRELYKEENYHNAKVTYEITPYKEHLSDLEIKIEEGKKVMIKEIAFEGNEAFSDRKLKKVMKTSEKGFFSWITDSGVLNAEDLRQDSARLNQFYHNHGYVEASISEPEVQVDGESIHILVKIKEGAQYKVGRISLSTPEGESLILPQDDILEPLLTGKETGEVFSRETVQKDILTLSDLYMDQGYAYAEIYPAIRPDRERLEVDITFNITKGPEVYYEKIIITGNTKTREKVIRRELPIQEQALYNGSLMKRGVRNLVRLDFFEDVKVDTVKGSDENKMILKINVKEKPTGAFMFGGGYSNTDDAFGMVSIGQKNLFGRGQSLDLKAQMGGSSSKFSMSFTEPWLFDSRLTAGADLYNWTRDYDTYTRDRVGGTLSLGYPIWDYTRAYVSYAYDISDINDISIYASDLVWEVEGENVESSVKGTIAYDSRNKSFNATKGSYHKASVQYAGGPMGGDLAFTKYVAESGWLFPLFWDTVFFAHGKAGFVEENKSHGYLPTYERFYLGGINSMRGYTWEDLSPEDDDGALIGGNKFVQFNLEFHFPLVKEAGLIGLAFYDTGDVYNNGELVNLQKLRESWGFGIRWYSPVGPIRLERGYIIDPQGDEDSDGRWEFTMGGAF